MKLNEARFSLEKVPEQTFDHKTHEWSMQYVFEAHSLFQRPFFVGSSGHLEYILHAPLVCFVVKRFSSLTERGCIVIACLELKQENWRKFDPKWIIPTCMLVFRVFRHRPRNCMHITEFPSHIFFCISCIAQLSYAISHDRY